MCLQGGLKNKDNLGHFHPDLAEEMHVLSVDYSHTLHCCREAICYELVWSVATIEDDQSLHPSIA